MSSKEKPGGTIKSWFCFLGIHFWDHTGPAGSGWLGGAFSSLTGDLSPPIRLLILVIHWALLRILNW